MMTESSLLDYYGSDSPIRAHIEELHCSFSVHKLHEASAPKGCIRIYVDIDHDILYDHISYQPALDITYSEEEYESLIKADLLVDNIKMHYLSGEALSKDIDEYYH